MEGQEALPEDSLTGSTTIARREGWGHFQAGTGWNSPRTFVVLWTTFRLIFVLPGW